MGACKLVCMHACMEVSVGVCRCVSVCVCVKVVHPVRVSGILGLILAGAGLVCPGHPPDIKKQISSPGVLDNELSPFRAGQPLFGAFLLVQPHVGCGVGGGAVCKQPGVCRGAEWLQEQVAGCMLPAAGPNLTSVALGTCTELL